MHEQWHSERRHARTRLAASPKHLKLALRGAHPNTGINRQLNSSRQSNGAPGAANATEHHEAAANATEKQVAAARQSSTGDVTSSSSKPKVASSCSSTVAGSE